MLAHHPITGQEIRILRSAAQISSNNKTLVWLRDSMTPSNRWARWFPIVSEVGAVAVCGATNITAVVLDASANAADWSAVFPTIFRNDSETLFVAPPAVVDAFATAGLRAERTLVSTELYDNYPYLGEPIGTEDPIAKVVVAVAHVLRMNTIVWSAGDREVQPFGVRVCLDAWVRTCDGTLRLIADDADDAVVPRTWLIQQYFVHSSNRRAREIRTCLEKNLACPYIDHVLLLNERTYAELPSHPKLQTILIDRRLTYYDVLTAAQTHVPGGAGAIVLFSNSDIWFNDTLRALWRISLERARLFLALLRWEDESPPRLFGPRADSQDAWIVARDCLDFTPSRDDYDFPFGKPGCDNAITLLMMRAHFLVVNPAYTIQTMHLHASQVRNYDPRDVLYKPHYLYVEPTPIQSCAVVDDFSSRDFMVPEAARDAWRAAPLGVSFRRIINAVDVSGAATVCSMLRRAEDAWTYDAAGMNLWTPSPAAAPLLRLQGGAFVTADGLVSTFGKILVGKLPAWIAGWEAGGTSSLVSSIHVPALIAVPFDTACGRSLASWALRYLPRALCVRSAARAAGVNAEFLVPQVADIGAFLSALVWGDAGDARGNITVVPHMPDMNYYTEDAWIVPPVADHEKVTATDVAMLRALLPPATDGAGAKPVAVFCVEDDEKALCTRGWAESVAENILREGWDVRYVATTDLPSARMQAFRIADWIFGAGDALQWAWMARAGATLMEFMSTHAPRGDIIHLAGAAGLRYVLGAVQREPLAIMRQNAMLEVGRAIGAYGFRESLIVARATRGVGKPTIVLPHGAALTGIMSHAGDTFREMVELWEAAGYVQIERSAETGYCWWGGIGEILLYDRPTSRWWLPETPYQMALFGNCAPPGPGAHRMRQSVWGFWGRSPRALEAVASRGDVARDWSERNIASIFLGKVENGVQASRRTTADWSRAVELFSMPVDSTGAAYPYTQTEYLEKLCHAKFGLGLGGFGPKCNREIEYFCCGVVPIVTPDVDMKGYLVPPLEGVHYFIARTPEEVHRIIETTSSERWTQMSVAGRRWWQRWASAEGFFKLTASRIAQCIPYFNVGIPQRFIHT
jgi:hypothetical protein